MVIYLRDKNGNNLFETEIYIKTDYEKDGSSHRYVELSTNIYIEGYSELLINVMDAGYAGNSIEILNLINTFDNLYELRGWLWESYFMNKKNNPDEINLVIKEVKTMLDIVAIKYHLNLIED